MPSHKIWAINSNSIVWGFPIFSLAALSNKLISCGELGMFLVCHVFFFVFFFPVFPPLPNTQIQSFFPQRNKSKASLPSFYAAVCVHLFLYLSMVYFCFSSINAQACLLLYQASGRQLRSFPRFDRQVAGQLSPSLVFLFDLDLS